MTWLDRLLGRSEPDPPAESDERANGAQDLRDLHAAWGRIDRRTRRIVDDFQKAERKRRGA